MTTGEDCWWNTNGICTNKDLPLSYRRNCENPDWVKKCARSTSQVIRERTNPKSKQKTLM